MKEYKELTVLFELVAHKLQKKGTSTTKAILDAVKDYERAAENPKSVSVKPKDLTPEMIERLAR